MNKKVIGKMKHEVIGIPIIQLVGLKWKSHCLETLNNTYIKEAKGVNKNVAGNIIHKECFDLVR